MRITDEDRERIAGKRVVASISGGKDSAALSLWLTEQGVEHTRVFLDTGWEHEDTYAYLRGPLAAKIGPIAEVQGSTMAHVIREHGTFPAGNQRFCTVELKAIPMAMHLAALIDDGKEPVNAVGIRAEESSGRAAMTRWESQTWDVGGEKFTAPTWRPIIDFSLQDVIDIHQRHGLVPNPLYLRGRSRVGCRLCIHANKEDIRVAAEQDPAVIDEIRQWEAEINAAAAARAQARGGLIPAERTMFRLRRGQKFMPSPIDQVVAWSRTARGGKEEDKQVSLMPNLNDGCMRWGLCDSGSKP